MDHRRSNPAVDAFLGFHAQRKSPSLIDLVRLLCVAATAWSSIPPGMIPPPRELQGGIPFLLTGGTMTDGTLFLTDSSSRVWWSRDTGATWDTVPHHSRIGPRYEGAGFSGWSPLAPRVFHRSIMNRGDDAYWTPDSGWKDALVPDRCWSGMTESAMDPPGLMRTGNEACRTATFCRTHDGGRSWTFWFSLDSNLLGSIEPGQILGRFHAGMVWYSVPDSGYIRGTSDGIYWRRLEPPSHFQPASLFGCGPSCLAIAPSQAEWPDTAIVSLDTGRNWTGRSVSRPGVFVWELAEGSASLSVRSSNRFEFWLSASPEDPWTLVDTDSAPDRIWSYFWLGGTPYRIAPASIVRIDMGGTSIGPQNRRKGQPRRQKVQLQVLPIDGRGEDPTRKSVDPSGRTLIE